MMGKFIIKKMKTEIIFWYVVGLHFLNICAVQKRIVRTTSGLVRGKLNYYEQFAYYSFQGIPYAESPVGFLRFKPPIPKKPWKHVFDATKDGVVCPQWKMRYRFEQMSEDCLNLNIYVPKNFTHQLPVLMFIHGGGFALLSGNSDYLYGPQFFLQHQLIVVTLNFRIGPLGFLSLGIYDASGNAGIKDIILALKWIKKNIPRFGGNSNKITIGGHSSGAALVHYLMLMKQTEGLFQQAILISGSALNYRFLTQHPKDDALSLAKELGIESNDAQTILSNLQKIDVFDIIQAFKNLSVTNTNVLKPCALFAPCVEENYSHAVITENPLQIIKKTGVIQNVPVLTGINADEGVYMLPGILENPQAIVELQYNNELYIPSNVEYPKGSNEARYLGNSIRQIYFHYDNSESISLDRLLQFITDIRYIYSVYAWIKIHTSHSGSKNIYFYKFNFDGDLNWSKLNYQITNPGTSHADELGYIFVTNRTVNRIENANADSKHMIKITVRLFSNFIKFSTPEDNDIKWPVFDMKDQKYLMISPSPTINSLLNCSLSNKLQFWEKVYSNYYAYVENGGTLENRCRIYN